MPSNRMERWQNFFRYHATSPQSILTIFLLIVLAYLVLAPLYGLVERTILWNATDARISRDIQPGEITLFHWKNVLGGRISASFFYKPLLNTLLTGTIAALIAMLLGSILS